MLDHQYALDIHGRWVNAHKTKYRKYSSYFCDCPSKHRMKLVKPSGAHGKRGFCDYFAHIVKRSSSYSAVTKQPVCTHGGESVLHRQAKHVLREMVGRYSFVVFQCVECKDEQCISTIGCNVTIEVRSADGKWRYDCLLTRNKVPGAALEVVYAHKTGIEKVQAALAIGLQIAEFRAEDIMKLLTAGGNAVYKIENLQMRTGMCDCCLVEKSLRWMRDCYVDEFVELIDQEEAVAINYARMAVLNSVLAVNPEYRRCKKLLRLGMKRRVTLCIPMIGEITCAVTEECQHGVLASGFSKHLPTKQICIVLVQHDSDLCNINWHHHSVNRMFHVFLKCSTILSRLGSLAEEKVCMNDCRWAILKDMEKSSFVCANCGKYGHSSTECRVMLCIRCGRNNHCEVRCYARTDVLGNSI